MQKSTTKKKRTEVIPTNTVEETESYRRSIMASTGVNSTLTRDPVYNLTAGFSQQFDAVGKRRNEMRHQGVNRAENESGDMHSEGGQRENAEPSSRERLSTEQLRGRHDSPVYSHTNRQLANGDFIDRFSSCAFNGGTLAASVMAGKSKAMLTTCMRRSNTFIGSINEQQKMLVGSRMSEANVKNQPARLVYNGNEAHAAVGMVVDSIRSCVRTMDIFKQLANDDKGHSQNRLQQRGIDTLTKMYPFLQLDNDEALIGQYKSELKRLEGDNSNEAAERRRNLSWALKKATAVKERKLSEQRKFLTKLAEISNNVNEAERMFSSDGFVDELLEELQKDADNPPEDNGSGRRRTLEDSTILPDLLDMLTDNTEEQEIADDSEQTDGNDESPSGGAVAGTDSAD